MSYKKRKRDSLGRFRPMRGRANRQTARGPAANRHESGDFLTCRSPGGGLADRSTIEPSRINLETIAYALFLDVTG